MPSRVFEEVLDFWFRELTPSQWFKAEPATDELIRGRFLDVLQAAGRNELFAWREHGRGRLAEILVLDQFSRNCFRGSAEAFGSDPQALALAQEAVAAGIDRQIEVTERAFLYMPYMHSESQVIHDVAVKLFSQPGLENNLKFELLHKEIIDRFGRYPHRNALLGRASTAEELEFLKTNAGF